MKLYNFFRSGTSHRLRIVINPQGLVPALAHDGKVLIQSSAIIGCDIHPFKLDLTRWPLICAIDAACAQLNPFRLAAPALQMDAG